MTLHDWTGPANWQGMHDVWIVELLRHIKPQLPEGFRAYIGSVPTLAVDVPDGNPDISVRDWRPEQSVPETITESSPDEPEEEVAVLTLDPQTAVCVTWAGRLVSVVELISPRNKDRPASRAAYTARYLGYLMEGAHLLLVDVHRRPIGFSFAAAVAEELGLEIPNLPAPYAVSYRVGAPASKGGRFLGTWRRPLGIGKPLPTIPLALSDHVKVLIDLDVTYSRAAEDNYLS